MDPRKLPPWAGALVALLGLVVATALGSSWMTLPAPLPESAPATEFSAARARAHLEAIARRPRLIGSAEHARARGYLIEQLRALGLDPQIQEAVSEQSRYRGTVLGTVRNVMARLPGTGSGKALLLMAHYDTRSMTPGASDDGYGVAALLETARALRAGGGQLASDVIFLFTDGEEEGLLGARAFVSQHPWARDVGLALNFEARGDAGPALMFQTGDDNGALVRALGRTIPVPAANSLSQAVYRRMPNDTDLTELLPRTPSLNFANIGGFERYHAPTDTVENADLGTLQHHGSQALALTRAFAAATLPLPREPDAVYFDAGPVFVRYAGALELPLAAASCLLLVAFVVVGHRRRTLHAGRAALALLAILALVVASAAASYLLWSLAKSLHPAYALLNAASPTLKGLHLASFLALAVALMVAFQSALRRQLRPIELYAAAATIIASLAVLTAATLKGGAFLFTWPVLASLPAAFAYGALPGDELTPRRLWLAVAASVTGLFFVSPFVPQLFGAFGPDAGPVLAGIAVLLAASAAPALACVIAPAPRAVPLAAAGIAVVLGIAAHARAPFDAAYPRPDTVFFAVDADAGRGAWCTPDAEPPAWAGGVFAGATRGAAPVPYPLDGVTCAPAAADGEAGPQIVWGDEVPVQSGQGRVLRLRVVPPPQATQVAVRMSNVASATVSGHILPATGGTVAFRFFAPPSEGVEIAVTMDSAQKVRVEAVSQREGFPAGVMPRPGVRPAGAMPKPGMMKPWDPLLESDMTISARASAR